MRISISMLSLLFFYCCLGVAAVFAVTVQSVAACAFLKKFRVGWPVFAAAGAALLQPVFVIQIQAGLHPARVQLRAGLRWSDGFIHRCAPFLLPGRIFPVCAQFAARGCG
ncbi:hypothetical protein [Undibacterium squillarum]|uniref:hypothetical protein n=1 Tax=Undibacterium squillarum TaxID=1131567 RepID=UPI0016776CFE|nr:hypothetical protein [Undibacterium squillarum]